MLDGGMQFPTEQIPLSFSLSLSPLSMQHGEYIEIQHRNTVDIAEPSILLLHRANYARQRDPAEVCLSPRLCPRSTVQQGR